MRPIDRSKGRTLAERFLPKIEIDLATNCWQWQGSIDSTGYGRFRFQGKQTMAHRFAYEWFLTPIPNDLVIDHLCRNRACVSPAHLEPVTNRENLLRGQGLAADNVRKTHCPSGHPYSGENLIVLSHRRRGCRACKRLQNQTPEYRAQRNATQRLYRQKKRAQQEAS